MSDAYKLGLKDALRQFCHRYTMEHVPAWSQQRAPGGRFYAPQYRTDREWYDNTEFPVGKPYCVSTNHTWPLGQWLDAPYYYGDKS